jgi:cbb3-type cytochrome oxidase maturation protein
LEQETNMYYYGWTILVSISLWVSLLAFVWAVRSGQFSNQGRARFLPLAEGYPTSPSPHGRKRALEGYALLVIAALGTMAFLSAIYLSLCS